MKRFLLGICAVILCGCAARGPVVGAPNPDFLIKVAFNYDFTNFNACGGAVTTGCISGFTWGYLAGTTPVPLKTSPASVCTGATQPEACADSTNSKLPMGNLNFYVIANFLDNTGAVGVTNQDVTATPTKITAPDPTAVKVTAQ